MSLPHLKQPIRPLPVEPKKYREEILSSPNYSAHREIRPEGVVFHHTCGTWEGDTSWICDPKSQVSYHCIINRDGTRRIFVADHHRAWHAGVSSWRGRSDCNSWLLGCAFSGDTYPDRKFGHRLTDDEIASALDWLAERWSRWGFTLANIVDHRQVSPGRKDDLNPAEWTRLLSAIKARFAA